MIDNLIEPQWLIKDCLDCPEKSREWLLHQGSFMERLKQHGIQHSEIIVLKHTWEHPLPSEQKILTIKTHEEALVREVLIKSAVGNWMFARTIFPKETLTETERQFIHLENNSLGSILFNYPDLQRSEFEMACLQQHDTWHQKIAQLVAIQDKKLWARRSVFTIRNKAILLSEVFLPDVFLLG